jgi:cellulose 1,4-beta-cellobiosidase
VTAVAGNGQVVLNWTGTVSGTGTPTQYHVKRTVQSGRLYSELIRSDYSSTTFTDTAVNNGVTYYYVVYATDNYCPSSDSTEVSGKPGS